MDRKRRNFVGYMALLGLTGVVTVPFYEKIPRLAISYQTSSKDGLVCKECIHFQKETVECSLIEGAITPGGCCRLFESPTDQTATGSCA
ncbi:MAG: iron oxidase oxidoreductase [Sulfurimonadaceae bacterium]|nr:iron oxidase oxidoreductase [Sulfurimonadaceae bacterium]